MYGKRYSQKKRSSPRKAGKKAPKAMALSKRIALLEKKTKIITERDQYAIVEGIDCASPYVVRNLSNYNAWFKLWTSTSTSVAGVRSTMYHRYFKIDNLITLDNVNNEEGTVNFTYFIISRKDTASTATDTGNALSLVENTDYVSTSGLTFMNLKKWKIHFMKKFTLTSTDTTELQPDQAQRRFTATVKVNAKVTNPDGSWTALANSPDPSDTYYAVVFTDNSSADLENPRWTFTCLHSVDN